MNTINLVYPEKGNISFKISQFPDGQQDVTITSPLFEPEFTCIDIISRLNSFKDLELILCATAALKRICTAARPDIRLNIPYLLGARSDREFTTGGTSYLVDVISPILNAQEYNYVSCWDVHSNVAPACIKRLHVYDNENLVKWAMSNYLCSFKEDVNRLVFMSPDAGASHKIYKLAEKIQFTGDIITCSKERNQNGKLTKTNIPWHGDFKDGLAGLGKDVVIIDDICDGGNTFINIAKGLRKKNFDGKIYLIVTHGIFSKGFDELTHWIDGIFCTNSYSDITAIDHINNKNFIFKQLNIF